MRATVIIQNLKCNTCRNTVISITDKFNGISNVDVDITIGSLSFSYKSHNAIEGLRIRLSEIGHPITEDRRVIKNINLEGTLSA